jgi:hypothetical protein
VRGVSDAESQRGGRRVCFAKALGVLCRCLVLTSVAGCTTSSARDQSDGACDAALTKRKAGDPSCYEDRCTYLKAHPDLVVSFRFALHKTVDADHNIPESEQIHDHECVSKLLADAGVEVLPDSTNDQFHDEIVTGAKLADVRAALALALVDSVEPGCVGGCPHCLDRSPGKACDDDPFCVTLNAVTA